MIENRILPYPTRARGGGGLDLGSGLIAACFLLLAATVVVGGAGKPADAAAFMLATTALLVAGHRAILAWQGLVCLVIGIVLFVPIGRFFLPVNLPFDLELYRVVVAFVLLAWGLSLLVDPGVRLRHTPLDLPIAVIVAAILGSIVTNVSRVLPLESAVLKAATFMFSYVLVYYLITSVITTKQAVVFLTKFIVAGCSIVAFFSMIEQRTHFNVFDRIGTVLPFLRYQPLVRDAERDGVWRAIGSSEHPIALGVLFVMVIPIGFALARAVSRVWWIPTILLAIGIFSTASRTPILAITAAGLVLLWLRPREVVRFLPLIVPLILVIKIAVPGSIVTIKNAFFPTGGLIQQATVLSRQSDPLLAGGRIRQIGPMLSEGSRTPVFGQGLGTRQTGFTNPLRNAPILDNEWLSLFMDVGLAGVIGWATLLIMSVRRLVALSRTRDGPDGWLAAGYAASLTGFATGMFTYDSISFTQIAFIFWMIIALSISFLMASPQKPRPVVLGEAERGRLAATPA